MAVKEDRNRRLDFRQDDIIRMNEVLLTNDEYEIELNRVGVISDQSSLLHSLSSGGTSGHEISSAAHLSPEVTQALELLDAKLNYVIGMNVLQQTDHSDMKEYFVNMSATGMRFNSNIYCKRGEHLKITMSLPLAPPMLLEVLAEVVDAKKVAKGQTQLGVAFMFRCEEEEDSVVRYIFKRQRETIRMKYREKSRSRVRYTRLDEDDLV